MNVTVWFYSWPSTSQHTHVGVLVRSDKLTLFQAQSLQTAASGTWTTCRFLGRSGSVTSPAIPSRSAGTWTAEAERGSRTTSSTSTRRRTRTPTSSNTRLVPRHVRTFDSQICVKQSKTVPTVSTFRGLEWRKLLWDHPGPRNRSAVMLADSWRNNQPIRWRQD